MLAVLALAAASCGDDDGPKDGRSEGGPTQVDDDTNDHWNRHFLPDGTFVWCITSDQGGNGDHAARRGMSCDWVDYHLRYPR